MKNRKTRLVIIGNGMVGYKFCELMTESRGGDRFEITVFGEEPRPAYDRVHLTEYFTGHDADALSLAPAQWYREQGIRLYTGDPVVRVERDGRIVESAGGKRVAYDALVLATGSRPFVPPIPGVDDPRVFVYRTLEDLDAILARSLESATAAVMGGGLLGLEAARALHDRGLHTHVLETNPHLMARQLDPTGGGLLKREIERMGVRVHTSVATAAIEDKEAGLTLRFREGDPLAVDLLVISAGIRPRDDLARACGLAVHERGGIVVDDTMRTSDPAVYAIGECAIHDNNVYGLVAPCYQMAETAVRNLLGEEKSFRGADLSTRLKLMGVEVATVGDSVLPPGADEAKTTSIVIQDDIAGVYKKMTVDRQTNRLIGAILIGSTRDYGRLVQTYRAGTPLPEKPISLVMEGTEPAPGGGAAELLCTCNNVTSDDVAAAVRNGHADLAAVCRATQAGTGCGGCKPMVEQLIAKECARLGMETTKQICVHFPLSRQELFDIVRVRRYATFDEVLTGAGQGGGCERCQPLVASLLASIYGETAARQPTIQDTNDRFLANIQRGGTYSVVPRIPGGEITPRQLIVLGEIAEEFGLYCKVTGGQRIDMFGAPVERLPEIWERLIEVGFESGHAYAKGMRTVKSCVGSTWCRFGVLDSTALAIRIEHRYKGLRSPHKLKSAVSGCIRECAEARGKDFGIIATEDGWNLYVGGNGGARPRHAELLAAGLDDETCIRYIDRFLMFYIRTADPLMRTSTWLEQLDGGLDYLKRVIVEDALGLGDKLEAEMADLVGAYECEWTQVVRDPEKRRRFRAFVNTPEADAGIRFVSERGQIRPASGGGQVESGRRGKPAPVLKKEVADV